MRFRLDRDMSERRSAWRTAMSDTRIPFSCLARSPRRSRNPSFDAAISIPRVRPLISKRTLRQGRSSWDAVSHAFREVRRQDARSPEMREQRGPVSSEPWKADGRKLPWCASR
jgi:hypothetical protein